MHRPHHQFTRLAILAALATVVVGACGGGIALVTPAASAVAARTVRVGRGTSADRRSAGRPDDLPEHSCP